MHTAGEFRRFYPYRLFLHTPCNKITADVPEIRCSACMFPINGSAFISGILDYRSGLSLDFIPVFLCCLLLPVIGRMIIDTVFQCIRQILLLYPVIRIIMRIQIMLSLHGSVCTVKMDILECARKLTGQSGSNISKRSIRSKILDNNPDGCLKFIEWI